jgi:hypothetical protein
VGSAKCSCDCCVVKVGGMGELEISEMNTVGARPNLVNSAWRVASP